MTERLFTVDQVAELLGATPAMVQDWISQGWLVCQDFQDGARRVSERGLLRFLRGRGINIEEVLAGAVTTSGSQEQPYRRPQVIPAVAWRQLPSETATAVVTEEPPVDFDPQSPAADDPAGDVPLAELVEHLDDCEAPPSSGEASQRATPAEPETGPTPPPAQPDGPPQTTAELADAILRDAVLRRAEALHIEPTREGLSIRLRLDGVLVDKIDPRLRLSRSLAGRIIGRYTFLAGLKVEPAAVRQGSFALELAGRPMRFDLSLCPTLHGQRAVLRITDPSAQAEALGSLGLGEEDEAVLRTMLARPSGLVLLAGMPGGGRHALLRGIAAAVASRQHAVCLIEHAAERHVDGAVQCSLLAQAGLSLAQACTALAADGDVLLVDDVRDAAAAQAVVQAAYDGRLVVAGVQAADAAAALATCSDLATSPAGLPANNPDQLMVAQATAWLGVIEQRAARRICRQCRRPHRPAEESPERLWLAGDDVGPTYRGQGCEACSGTGYDGRVGLFSILEATAAARTLLRRGAPAEEVVAGCRRGGGKTLRQDALDKLRAGLTSLEELVRVLPE